MKQITNELKQKTNRSDKECQLINEILNNHFIVGRNNKEKIINDFKDQLKIDSIEADKLYNICAEIIIKGIYK